MSCRLLDSRYVLVDPATDMPWRIDEVGDPPAPVATPADRLHATYFPDRMTALLRMAEIRLQPAEVVRVDR